MSAISRQSGFLKKEDYVTAANVFVDATAADYVSVSDLVKGIDMITLINRISFLLPRINSASSSLWIAQWIKLKNRSVS